MLLENIIIETAAAELAKKLPSLRKHDYDTIDRLMRNIANKHKITHKALTDLFVHKYKQTPDKWINGKLDEVKVSNVARSAEQIAEDYRLGANHYFNRTISSTDLSAKTDSLDALKRTA